MTRVRTLIALLFLTACATAAPPAENSPPASVRADLPPRPADEPPARARDTTSTRRADARPGVLQTGAPSAGERVAEWERRFPGNPIPATVVLERPMGDAALMALLDRHGARPYAGYVRVAAMGGEHRLPRERAGAAAIAETRGTALHVAQQGVCHNAQRLESWAIEAPRGWPEAGLLEQARALLAQYEAAQRAAEQIARGTPVIYAVEVLAPPRAVAALAATEGVLAAEPALILDDTRILVPAPEPRREHDIAEPAVTGELWRLAPDALVERMRAAGSAPRPDCDRRGPPLPAVPADTIAPEDRPLPTIPPAVHPVFRIDGTALGTFRPDEPVDLVARVTADAVVDTMELTITVPELADARRTDWGAAYDRLGVGVRYPSLDSVTGPIRRDTPLLLRRRVIFRAPGYYFVSMVVRARTRPITDRALPTVDEAFHSFLIWIDEEGGFVARDLDPTRYPIGSENQGGPVRMPARRTEERALIERARSNPETRATVRGTVRSSAGEPVADVRITARAYMQRCPGRGAAEAVTRSGADGSYALDLPAWPTESFVACVAIHADPPPTSGLAPVSVQEEIRFLRNPRTPQEVDLVLPPAPAVHDPAHDLALPGPVRAAADAPAYSAVVQTIHVDATGDGAADRVELSVDAELNARGEPIYEHAHRWRVIVRTAAGTFPLSDEFVPSGDVRIRIESAAIDERGAPPAIVISWRSRESWGERRLRHDAAARTFVTESIVRVSPD